MSIIASELKFYESTNNLGGAIVLTEIVDNDLHNLFDIVDTAEAEVGDIEYRCFYVKNTNGSISLDNALIYIQTASSYPTKTSIGIALGSAAIDATEQTIADEGTLPGGLAAFNEAAGAGSGLAIGNLAAGSYKSVWVRRTILADANASDGVTATLALQGDTV